MLLFIVFLIKSALPRLPIINNLLFFMFASLRFVLFFNFFKKIKFLYLMT